VNKLKLKKVSYFKLNTRFMLGLLYNGNRLTRVYSQKCCLHLHLLPTFVPITNHLHKVLEEIFYTNLN